MDFIRTLESQSSEKAKRPRAVLAFGVIIGGLAAFFSIATIPFIFPFFRRVCLPYVPATTQQVQNVMEALKGRSGKFIDLGSGDGRIVLAAARNGFDATGIELNPWLIIYSKVASLYAGLSHKAQFYRTNLWTFNLKPYENVVIFGVESMMEDLEKKFNSELGKDTRIIACRFPLPGLTPIKVIGVGIDKVWIYKS